MPRGRGTYLRWLAVAAMALAAELAIASVAIVVVVRAPSATVAKSTAPTGSPVPSQPPNSQRPPNPPPPPPAGISQVRQWAAGAFYPPSGKVVLFGGLSSLSVDGTIQASNDTWTWDGAHWQQLHPVNSPPARYWAGLAYDPLHQVLVLYGGSADQSGTFLNDTWTWDGTNWKQMSPPESPTKWFTAPMTYDATHKVVLLYVGVGEWPIPDPNQTWEWDGSAWTQIATLSNPNANSPTNTDGTIVYDSTTSQTLFVGASGTWVLQTDGSWSRIGGSGTSNGSIYHSGSRYAVTDDPAQGVLLEVGLNGDTWTWDGKAWTAQNPSVAPSPRSGEALVYDASRQQVVLVGGSASPNWTTGLTDTWTWDGKTWKQVA